MSPLLTGKIVAESVFERPGTAWFLPMPHRRRKLAALTLLTVCILAMWLRRRQIQVAESPLVAAQEQSPEGDRIVIRRIGPDRRLTDLATLPGNAGDFVLSPDKKHLGYIVNFAVWVCNLDGSKSHAVTPVSGRPQLPSFSFSPDGTQLAVCTDAGSGGPNSLMLYSPSGAPRNLLNSGTTDCKNPAFSPDGSSVIAACDGGGDPTPLGFNTPAGPYHLVLCPLTGGQPPVNLPARAGTDVDCPAFLPGGIGLLYVESTLTSAGIYQSDLSGNSPVLLARASAPVASLECSPDGRSALFSSAFWDPNGFYQIGRVGLVSLQGNYLTNVTAGLHRCGSAWYSSDGRSVYFVRSPGGIPGYGELYTSWIDGTHTRALTPMVPMTPVRGSG